MKKIKSALFIVIAASMGISAAKAQTVVTLDYYYNHESHVTKEGKTERFHYIWEEKDLNGYSNWGDAFVKNGAS